MKVKETHLVRTEADKKAEQARYETMPGDLGGEDYPYGTRVRLDHDTLAKMGINDASQLPKSGAELNVKGKAKVVSTSSEDRDGEARHSMELQLTHMGMEDGAEEAAQAQAAKSMYPSTKG